ncbi:MAG: protein kinase [Planctomycetota bacterium]
MAESVSPQPSGRPAAVTTLSLKPGDKVDAFTVVETIAATGSAVVYKAHDPLLDRHVAVKQIILGQDDSDDALRKRIRDEAAIHKRVSASQPKHLIQFIDAVDDPRGLMLVSEFYPSTSLEDLLDRQRAPLDERQALGIVAATAKGLEAIHDAGVVHRDLKPSNVLLGDDGGLKICDFGLSALIEAQDSLSLGSVRYMAPELLRSEPADGRADVYSLGLIAYEMLAGRPNFDVAFRNVLRDQRNQAMRWMKWHTNLRVAAPPLDEHLPDLPPHLTQLVARMMEKDPARRVATADDVVEAIRRHFTGDGPDVDLSATAAAGSGVAASTPGDTAPLPTRSRLPLILVGLLGFWAVVGASLLLINDQKRSAAQAQALDEANAMINSGIAAYDEGDTDSALENYRIVAEAWPDDSPVGQKAQLGVWRAEGRLAFDRGDYAAAVDAWTEYRENGGRAAGMDELLDEAVENRNFEAFVAAVNLTLEGQAFREAKQNIADFRQSELTEEQEDRLDALDDLIDRRRSEALAAERFAEARRQAEAGDRAAAIALLEDLSELPEEAAAYLGELRDDAAYDAAIAAAAEAERTGRLAEAIASLREAAALRPDEALTTRIDRLDARRLTAAGAALFENGSFEAAGERFAEALEKDPDNADALRLRRQIEAATELTAIEAEGDAAAAVSDFDTAVAAYERALAVAPDNPAIGEKLDAVRVRRQLGLARRALDRGDLPEARARLEEARAVEPDNETAATLLVEVTGLESYADLLRRGDAARAAGDYGRARRLYLQAEEQRPGEEIELRLADTEFDQAISQAREFLDEGQVDAARAVLQPARRLRPNDPRLVELLGDLEDAAPAEAG